jgi:hypothetical protein
MAQSALADRVPVALRVSGCELDREALAAELAVELPSHLGAPVEITEGPGALRVELTCDQDPARLVVSRGLPFVLVQREIPLADVDASMRVRAVAVAAAELLRKMDSPPPPAPPLVIADDPETPEPLLPRPVPIVRQTHRALYGGLTIGLGVVALGAGAASLMVDDDDAPSQRFTMRPRDDHGDLVSKVALGVSAASLIASAVSFGLWMHARAMPTAVIDAHPLPGGGAMDLLIKF